jgi:hypothetical protein
MAKMSDENLSPRSMSQKFEPAHTKLVVRTLVDQDFHTLSWIAPGNRNINWILSETRRGARQSALHSLQGLFEGEILVKELWNKSVAGKGQGGKV